MTLTALNGFQSFPTHHCVTGSMRHIFAYNGFKISVQHIHLYQRRGRLRRWPFSLHV